MPDVEEHACCLATLEGEVGISCEFSEASLGKRGKGGEGELFPFCWAFTVIASIDSNNWQKTFGKHSLGNSEVLCKVYLHYYFRKKNHNI